VSSRPGRQAIAIPLAVKLSPCFSSLANLAGQLAEAGADGLPAATGWTATA
jgi:dihydroorotate dehydrogenase